MVVPISYIPLCSEVWHQNSDSHTKQHCGEDTSLSLQQSLLLSQSQPRHKQVLVSRDKLNNSKFYNNMMSDCQCEVIYFPELYIYVFL